jgi:undecaprenyl-phosphate 4-deoxy-4-formamido-L-arabinose transferase
MHVEPSTGPYSFSLVVPLYRSESSVQSLVRRLEELPCEEPWQAIIVDDGSPDNTYACMKEALKDSALHALLIRHTRNFGEHQAVLTGYRFASGDYFVNIDDDLQNPPDEALRLWKHARDNNLDVVYGNYIEKKHDGWRNLGSGFANATARMLLDMAGNHYLSSFRCVSKLIGKKLAEYTGPFVYIDGMLSQLTTSVDSLDVRHDIREAGESNYNMRRLIRLWLVILTSFSLMPLRIASLVGIGSATFGALSLIYIMVDVLLNKAEVAGWASVISAILFFGGIQCLLLGVVGEYIGRVYLSLSGKPQSCVRTIERFGES